MTNWAMTILEFVGGPNKAMPSTKDLSWWEHVVKYDASDAHEWFLFDDRSVLRVYDGVIHDMVWAL